MTSFQNASEIGDTISFPEVLPPHIQIHEGGEERPHLTFSGRSFFSIGDGEFTSKVFNHPKCPKLSPTDKIRFQNSYTLLDKFPFKRRRSGEPYSKHLERTVFYYLEFCPKPTIDGMIRALHHDSFEDFPDKRYKLQRTIGVTNLRATVGLSKMSPASLSIAQRTGKFSRVVDTHKRVRRSLEVAMPTLQELEFERSILRMAKYNVEFILPFLRSSNLLTGLEDVLSLSEGSMISPSSHDVDFLVMLGNLFQEIMLSGDQEDLIEELCLIIYLSESASEDDLYVKISGDRIDNLLDIEFLEKAVEQFDGNNREKIEKYFRSSQKALATSKAYLFLVKKRLKNPELYGVVSSLIRWSEDKLTTLSVEFSRKLNQYKTKDITLSAPSLVP